jgi:hypothetical protein
MGLHRSKPAGRRLGAALGALAGLAAPSAIGAGPAAPALWLELRAPAPDAVVRGPVELVEVDGFAGVGDAGRHDVALLIDASASTAVASGADVDADGRVGRQLRSSRDPLRSRNPNRLSTDPDDTVLAAEVAAARRLIGQLDLRRTRVALGRFGGAAEWLAPLGSDADTLEDALTRLAERSFASGTTNLAAALRSATGVLGDEAPPGPPAARAVIVLSDGDPTEPPPASRAASAARDAAVQAAHAGVRIHTFALGPEAAGPDSVYADLARRTGGRFVAVPDPGDAELAMGEVRLSGIHEIRTENATLGRPGRATRLFSDGSFDSMLPLEPGPNRIVVTVRDAEGREAAVERRIVYERRPARTAAQADAADALLERLRRRTLETELAVEAERGRGSQAGRELEIRAPAAEGGGE